MGTALEIESGERLATRLGGAPTTPAAPLAIASCGNAALAAAVVAAAWGRELHVFVPPDAEPAILGRLRELGARVAIVGRADGERGDPTYHALRRAIADGALPFTCQGNENGLAIEGGLTLGYELATSLRDRPEPLDRLFVQVGGGALASSVAQALDEAAALGAIERVPRIHAVQSRNVQPLVRAYRRVVADLASRLGGGEEPRPDAPPAAWRPLADRLRDAVAEPAGEAELRAVTRRRSSFMWPWEDEPHSVAHGIIDDETYDWFAVVRAMIRTGGFPVPATEETLEAAAVLGREATGIDTDATGAAGLAGLMTLRDAGEVDPAESVALLFTGARRTHRIGEPR
jgi:threonine synthase